MVAILNVTPDHVHPLQQKTVLKLLNQNSNQKSPSSSDKSNKYEKPNAPELVSLDPCSCDESAKLSQKSRFESANPLHATIMVSGIVQGVGFRPFIYRMAKRQGLRGFVRNRADAVVEISVEGEKPQNRCLPAITEAGKAAPCTIR